MSKRKCGNCGKDPAEGFASVWTRATGEVFYCHGDDGPSCYVGSNQTTTPAHNPAEVPAEVPGTADGGAR